MVLAFLLFGVIQTPDGPFKRPHPGILSVCFFDAVKQSLHSGSHHYYAPNFEEVEEAYWFGPVRAYVSACVGHTLHTVKNGWR